MALWQPDDPGIEWPSPRPPMNGWLLLLALALSWAVLAGAAYLVIMFL